MRKTSVIACTISAGVGNGIARMDSLLRNHINKSEFNFTTCYTNIAAMTTTSPYQDVIPVNLRNRFQSLLEIFSGADLVQFNGGFDPVAVDAAHCLGLPVVEVMHECDRGAMSHHIDLTVCVSEAVSDCQPNHATTRVIPNGVDTEIFTPTEDRDDSKIIILEVARRDKDLHFHIDEQADLLLAVDPRIELWLVGPGQAGETAHQGRVRFMGPREDMADLYRQAHYLVLTSKHEAFGLVCAEAMACGCLPVTSELKSLASVVKNRETGWLTDCSTPENVANALRLAIKSLNTTEDSEMRHQAAQRIIDHFSVKNCVSQYVDIYRELAKQHTGKQRPGITNVPFPVSAESLIGQTGWMLGAGAEPTEILTLWLNSMDTPLAPLREPDAPAWANYREMFKSLILSVAKAGYAPLAQALGQRLDRLYGE